MRLFAHIVALIVFGASIYLVYEEGLTIIVILSLLMFLWNLAAIKGIRSNHDFLRVFVNVSNAVLAAMIGFHFLEQERELVPYLWFGAAVFFLIPVFRMYTKFSSRYN